MRQCGCITCELQRLTGRLYVYRMARKKIEMDRVTEKLKQASGVVARSNAGLETEADRLIAREAQFEERKKEAFAPHHAVLDTRHREMDQLEDSLKIVSNADPLRESEAGSPEVEHDQTFHEGTDEPK